MRTLNDPKDCQHYARLTRRITETAQRLSSALGEREKLEKAIDKQDEIIAISRDTLALAESNLTRWQAGEDYAALTVIKPNRFVEEDEEFDE